MFTTEELGLLEQFFDITDNKENVLIRMDSRESKNKWMIVDFSNV